MIARHKLSTMARHIPAVAMVLAPLVWLAVAGGLVIGGTVGYRPLMIPVDLTLPEAAMLGDQLEMLRLLNAGADPRTPGAVRPTFNLHGPAMKSAYEAAVVSHSVSTLALLREHSRPLDQAEFGRLLCFAESERATAVATYIRETSSQDAALPCDDILRNVTVEQDAR